MNDLSGPSFFPTETDRVDNVEIRSPRVGTSHWRSTRFNKGQVNLPNPEVGVTNACPVLPELYFSGSENVENFLVGVDNNIKFWEIPSDLARAYLKGHLLGRARDWYEVFGSTLVQNTSSGFTQLKEALTKNFLVVWNRKDLEVQFNSSHLSRGQEPTDFIYDLLKVHKKLGLKIPKKN
ncbi:uncharacterized protein TNCV_833641 [Trichonephila clavipes]|nr:uncharacterized protein TNCV_833641 [Trichonephila clavipes]